MYLHPVASGASGGRILNTNRPQSNNKQLWNWEKNWLNICITSDPYASRSVMVRQIAVEISTFLLLIPKFALWKEACHRQKCRPLFWRRKIGQKLLLTENTAPLRRTNKKTHLKPIQNFTRNPSKCHKLQGIWNIVCSKLEFRTLMNLSPNKEIKEQ